jgi:hypothetical protein
MDEPKPSGEPKVGEWTFLFGLVFRYCTCRVGVAKAAGYKKPYFDNANDGSTIEVEGSSSLQGCAAARCDQAGLSA